MPSPSSSSHPNLGAPLLARPWGLGAGWLYHGEYNVWTWSPSPIPYQLDLDRLNLLIAADWQQVTRDSVNPSLLTLYGQMYELVSLVRPGTGERDRWAPRAAIDRLQRVPVALAFTLPDEVDGQLDALMTTFPTSTPEVPRKYLRMAQRLPPPQFGERALIFRQDGTIHARTAAALGDDARAGELLAGISRQLSEMAEPAGWRPWLPGLDDCRTQSGYERRRDDLRSQLLSRRDAGERDRIRTELELLDALRAHALDIQAYEARQARNPAAWREAVAEVAAMVQELADLYWQVEQDAERLATRRALPDIPGVFDDEGMVAVPSMMPVQTILDSYSAAAKGWQRDHAGIPTYRQTTREHDTAIQVRGEDPAELLDDARIVALWRQVGELSDLDGDVFLAMLAQQVMSWPDAVWIDAAHVLEYRGIKPKIVRDEYGRERRAGHRREDLLEVARCVGRQSTQWVHINSVIAEDVTASSKRGKPRKVRHTHVSKLTQIADVIYQHELMPDPGAEPGTAPQMLPLAWRYRIGTWLEPFMRGPNRKMAYLCRQALGYDPYHEKWEKRLARYFVFHLRINAAGGAATIKRTIGKLTDELSIDLDERNPERTRRRCEQALDRLVSDGVIDGWSYDTTNNPTLPARRWLTTWREWGVFVHAGAVTTQRHAPIAERAQTRRARATALGAARDAGAKRRKRGTRNG